MIHGLTFGTGFIDQSEVTRKGKRSDFVAVSYDIEGVVIGILISFSMNCISRLDWTPTRSIRLMAMLSFCLIKHSN